MNYLILPENKIDELYDEHCEAVLDACYRRYDSELRRENLTQSEIRAFFEAELQARPYLEGGTATGVLAGRFYSLSHWSIKFFTHAECKFLNKKLSSIS